MNNNGVTTYNMTITSKKPVQPSVSEESSSSKVLDTKKEEGLDTQISKEYMQVVKEYIVHNALAIFASPFVIVLASIILISMNRLTEISRHNCGYLSAYLDMIAKFQTIVIPLIAIEVGVYAVEKDTKLIERYTKHKKWFFATIWLNIFFFYYLICITYYEELFPYINFTDKIKLLDSYWVAGPAIVIFIIKLINYSIRFFRGLKDKRKG